MTRARATHVLAAAGLAGAMLAGCAVTDPSKYYVLGASRAVAPVAPAAPAGPSSTSAEASVTIGVGPIAIPAYLDRANLVTRDAADAVELWPYHRWAEPLDVGIAEALAEALSARVPSDRVAVYPWRGTLARVIDYQVVVAVARFDGAPGRAVTLDARWRVLGRDGQELAFKRTTLSEPAGGEGFAALVAAMHRAIGRLGEDIGDAIRSQARGRAAVRH
jgi:uncharacterized lipoprotein YmbA